MTNQTTSSQPAALSLLRVVEIGALPAAYCARLLGDLGADVIKVEPPGGDPDRLLPPFAGDIPDPERSLTFLNANVNKRSVVLDLAASQDDRRTLRRLLDTADIFVEATPVGTLEARGLSQPSLLESNPRLVTVSLTPFGQTGPYHGYKGSEAITQAMSGLLYVQGDDTRPPCVAPCHQAYQMAAAQAAFLAIVSARHARRTGMGQRIDVSLQEAMVYASMSGVSRYSQRSEIMARTGSRSNFAGSNVYECKDGRYAQMTIVLPGQWHALTKEWMEDPILSQPEWDDTQYRVANADLANHLIAEFALQHTADEFVEEAQRRHIPVAYVNTLREFLESPHIQAREWVQEAEHPIVGRYRAPGPLFRMSATPMRIRRPAPLLGQHQQQVLAEVEGRTPRGFTPLEPPLRGPMGSPDASGLPMGPRSRELEGRAPRSSATSDGPMLAGVRVADLTRAFAGPIGTMLLAFYGAEVIKVESEDLPATREVTSTFYAEYNRNKLSCAIDLRHPEGKELFHKLLAVSDVLVDNFSPGVVDRLGFGYQDNRKVRPDLIQVTMPGMGLSGPLRPWVTYGTEIEAYSGLTALWGYPDSPMPAHAKIVLPDYIGAALQALATVAALEYRDRTGEGQSIEICQLEGQAGLLGPAILDYAVNGRAWEAKGYREEMGAFYAPYGCYPCKGSDAWTVIVCETEEDWRGLVRVLGGPTWTDDPRFATREGRREHAEELDRHIADWSRGFTTMQLLRLLQAAGVPAGMVMTTEDLYRDHHLRTRGQIVETDHPRWGPLAYPGLPGLPSRSPANAAGLTPWIGDDNDYVFRHLLGMGPAEVRAKVESGAIH